MSNALVGNVSLLEMALSDFLLSRKVARCSERTIEHYRYTAGGFVAFLHEQGMDTLDVKPAHVRQYFASVQSRQVRDNTLHAHARGVRTFLRFLADQELLPSDPSAMVDMPRLDKRIMPVFSTDEIMRLIRACQNKRDRAIVLFLLDTGLRASELLALRVGDIDMRTGEVKVRKGKGGKDRMVVICDKTRRALIRYYTERGAPLLADPVWYGIGVSGLREVLRRLGKRAGVANCSPHTFRRTFATMSLRNGIDIFTLKQLMGHASIAMLQRYLVLSGEDLVKSHRSTSPVDRMRV